MQEERTELRVLNPRGETGENPVIPAMSLQPDLVLPTPPDVERIITQITMQALYELKNSLIDFLKRGR